MTWRGSEEFSLETSPFRRLVRGMIRRVAISLATGTKWQWRGQRGGAGGDEIYDAEPFTGIGFFSRPPASGSPEAILNAVGGSKNTVIVATRDEKTRRLIDADVPAGATCVYNDKAMILVKPDGTVEIRLIGGAAIALPTLADYNALRNAYNSHTHPVATTGSATAQTGTASATAATVAAPTGTTVLKAQ